MARSLLQAGTQVTQNLVSGDNISPGVALRRFGTSIDIVNDAINIYGPGYYTVDVVVVIKPSSVGTVEIGLVKDGEAIGRSQVFMYASTASQPIAIPLCYTIFVSRGVADPSILELRLMSGSGEVTRVQYRIVREKE